MKFTFTALSFYYQPIRIGAFTLILVYWYVASGCASPVTVNQAHINIEPEGYIVNDQEQRIVQNAVNSHITAELNKIETYITNAGGAQPVNLMIFVHGGLVSTHDALTNNNALVDADHKLKNTNVHPVFVNWNSSLKSALVDDLFLVRKGQRRPITGVLTSPFIILSRTVNSVLRGIPNLTYQYDTEKTFFEEWEKEDIRDNTSYKLKQTGKTLATLPVTLVTVPLFSGYGEGSWNMMKRRIDQMFAVEISPLPTEGQDAIEDPGGLRLFIKAFRKQFLSRMQSNAIKVDIVGHSMGAIVTTRLLREFPDIPFNRIIYLAPATSIEDFQKTIPHYLAEHTETRFHSYSLSILDETQELNYIAPKGSLLVWIDNLFEPGLSAEDRRVGNFLNRRAFRVDKEFLEGNDVLNKSICRRMRFVKFTGELGPNSNKKYPYKHGSFDENVLLQNQLKLSTFNYNLQASDYMQREKDFYQRECTACAIYAPCEGWIHR